jgi:hypothetical protein
MAGSDSGGVTDGTVNVWGARSTEARSEAEACAPAFAEAEGRHVGRVEDQAHIVIQVIGRVEPDECVHPAGASLSRKEIEELLERQRANFDSEQAAGITYTASRNCISAQTASAQTGALRELHAPNHVFLNSDGKVECELEQNAQPLRVTGPGSEPAGHSE